ncbi:hypothetical protein [Enterococcus rotai]|uniref:hypothetical protein n=1 Tax=Enterococcus rotai TaxID=118060 RepID=UPI0035C70419
MKDSKKNIFSYWIIVLLICGTLAITGLFIDLYFNSVDYESVFYSDNIMDDNYGNGAGFMFAISIISLFLIVAASIYNKIKSGFFYDKSALTIKGVLILIITFIFLIGLAIYTGLDIYYYFFIRESY